MTRPGRSRGRATRSVGPPASREARSGGRPVAHEVPREAEHVGLVQADDVFERGEVALAGTREHSGVGVLHGVPLSRTWCRAQPR